jgi:hypothetical protein
MRDEELKTENIGLGSGLRVHGLGFRIFPHILPPLI